MDTRATLARSQKLLVIMGYGIVISVIMISVRSVLIDCVKVSLLLAYELFE